MVVRDELNAVPKGELCYFHSSPSSALPIRDVLGECRAGCKVEPDYEHLTYNTCASCCQTRVAKAAKDNFKYILFATRYNGTKAAFRGRVFIVGYYESKTYAYVADRFTVEASRARFADIENAFEITSSVLRRWGRSSDNLRNLRYLPANFEGRALYDVLECLDKSPNSLSRYVEEVKRLERQLPHQRL